MLDVTLSTMLSFATMSILLTIYALFDFRQQLIPNQIILAGFIIGSLIVIFSGHVLQNIILHLTSSLFVTILSLILFRLGAFGGADVKIVITVAIISPGIEFASWNNQFFEAVLAAGLQLVSMLAGGYLYSKIRVDRRGLRVVPLIPILLSAYLALQLLALF